MAYRQHNYEQHQAKTGYSNIDLTQTHYIAPNRGSKTFLWGKLFKTYMESRTRGRYNFCFGKFLNWEVKY